MSPPRSDEFGITLRQLQILAILWDAGQPIPRSQLLSQFHERTGDPLEDASLVSLMRGLDDKGMLSRHRAERTGTPGRTPTLYSATADRRKILTRLLDTLFHDAFRDNPVCLDLAIEHLQKLAAETGSPGSPHPPAR